MDILQDFDPIVVGTIPIGIDIDSSDLDIICFWQDQHFFNQKLADNFMIFEAFQIRAVTISNESTTVANFRVDHLEFEILDKMFHLKVSSGIGTCLLKINYYWKGERISGKKLSI